jgi:hypothetical protein
MGYCSNCKARLTCSCQKRVSKDGKAGCQNCITGLNTTKTKSSPTKNDPNTVKAIYNGPGIQTK